MKRMLLILIAASVVSFIVCTNGTESKQNGTEQWKNRTSFKRQCGKKEG